MWTPDGSGLVFVGWANRPENFSATARRLGIVYCFNRPCHLLLLPYVPPPPPAAELTGQTDGQTEGKAVVDHEELQPKAVKLSGELLSALSPVFSPDGKTLACLSQQAAAASGVHAATSSLYTLDWVKVQEQCMMGRVAAAAAGSGGGSGGAVAEGKGGVAAAGGDEGKGELKVALQEWNEKAEAIGEGKEHDYGGYERTVCS